MLKHLNRSISRILDMIVSVAKKAIAGIYRSRFASHGNCFSYDVFGVYTWETISVGNNVNLGYRPVLIASQSRIEIGNNVMFGPQVTIRGGNHRTDLIGRTMVSIKPEEKRPEDDPGVVIEDDVWVGTRAGILAGVRIGEDAIVAAGAVVTQDVAPYSIMAGVPAKAIGRRWDDATIAEHRRTLYGVQYSELTLSQLRC
jgi:acetyltransferase-like isoleucine patch superfamily enzyme